jgi:hypothetical protein
MFCVFYCTLCQILLGYSGIIRITVQYMTLLIRRGDLNLQYANQESPTIMALLKILKLHFQHQLKRNQVPF